MWTSVGYYCTLYRYGLLERIGLGAIPGSHCSHLLWQAHEAQEELLCVSQLVLVAVKTLQEVNLKHTVDITTVRHTSRTMFDKKHAQLQTITEGVIMFFVGPTHIIVKASFMSKTKST